MSRRSTSLFAISALLSACLLMPQAAEAGTLPVTVAPPSAGRYLVRFVPGTDGENRFGPKTPPNGAGAVALALILPAVFVVGIVAAIALPAYQQYLQRASATQNK